MDRSGIISIYLIWIGELFDCFHLQSWFCNGSGPEGTDFSRLSTKFNCDEGRPRVLLSKLSLIKITTSDMRW